MLSKDDNKYWYIAPLGVWGCGWLGVRVEWSWVGLGERFVSTTFVKMSFQRLDNKKFASGRKDNTNCTEYRSTLYDENCARWNPFPNHHHDTLSLVCCYVSKQKGPRKGVDLHVLCAILACQLNSQVLYTERYCLQLRGCRYRMCDKAIIDCRCDGYHLH